MGSGWPATRFTGARNQRRRSSSAGMKRHLAFLFPRMRAAMDARCFCVRGGFFRPQSFLLILSRVTAFIFIRKLYIRF